MMDAELVKSFEALLANLRNVALDLDDRYKTIAAAFDDIPRLKNLVESKDTELGNLRNEIAKLQSQHKCHLQENLELYQTQHNKLEGEKAELAGSISTLQTTIQQKDADLSEYTRMQKTSQEQLDEGKKLLAAEKDQAMAANANITKLQQKLKEKDGEIKNLKERVHKQKTQNSKAESTAQYLKKELESLQGEFQLKAERLEEIESFTTKLQEGDETVWIKQLDDVWEAACKVVASLFNTNLAEDQLKDKSAWKDFRESQYLEHTIPLPRSNSPAAKQMRTAALLAILARSIVQHIFQPTYLLKDKDEIRSILAHLAIENSKKESFCRSVLLSILPNNQAIKNGINAREQVVRDVALCVRNLVSEAQYDIFRSGVEDIVQKAQETWWLIQNTREKFEPYFNLYHYADLEWQTLSFDNDGFSIGGDSMNRTEDDEALLMIFPRIYMIADSNPEPVTAGVVLMKSQSILAVEEMKSFNPPSPTTARASLKSKAIRSRALSLLGNGTKAQSQPTQSGVH